MGIYDLYFSHSEKYVKNIKGSQHIDEYNEIILSLITEEIIKYQNPI
jgi:hypothetical protein